ncbi:Uncharacterised protein [Enterobacter cloacae]|uniref:Uncharacterized protein n=1 Tax=Enterobacter cloacae TaxID=550 RepID=A0A377M2Q0_ENTCL|nr:Uncharacterised protein [Enterobacter cloacae]
MNYQHPCRRLCHANGFNENLGEPLRSAPPYTVMNRDYGWTDLYEVKDHDIPTSMQINYDVEDSVRSITYMLTSELRW